MPKELVTSTNEKTEGKKTRRRRARGAAAIAVGSCECPGSRVRAAHFAAYSTRQPTESHGQLHRSALTTFVRQLLVFVARLDPTSTAERTGHEGCNAISGKHSRDRLCRRPWTHHSEAVPTSRCSTPTSRLRGPNQLGAKRSAQRPASTTRTSACCCLRGTRRAQASCPSATASSFGRFGRCRRTTLGTCSTTTRHM